MLYIYAMLRPRALHAPAVEAFPAAQGMTLVMTCVNVDSGRLDAAMSPMPTLLWHCMTYMQHATTDHAQHRLEHHRPIAFAAGKCPGPDDFQCCTISTCPGGKCLRTSACGGTSTSGLCPGPADVQCCTATKNPTPSPSPPADLRFDIRVFIPTQLLGEHYYCQLKVSRTLHK